MTTSKLASLELTLNAYKSLIADYATRAQQAENMASFLLKEKVEPQELGFIIGQQLQQRSNEKAVQQQALLQATLIALHAGAQSGNDVTLREVVNNVIRDLSMSLSYMIDGGQKQIVPNETNQQEESVNESKGNRL